MPPRALPLAAACLAATAITSALTHANTTPHADAERSAASGNSPTTNTPFPHTSPQSAGDATTPRQTAGAFKQRIDLTGLTRSQRRQLAAGDTAAIMAWGTPPNAGRQFDGLGPTFNNSSCFACHHQGGRGHADLKPTPYNDDPSLRTALVRVSIPNADDPDAHQPVPHYGTQLRTQAVTHATPDAHVRVTWQPVPGTYPDGTAYELRRPILTITPNRGPLPDDLLTSLRVAQPIFGLGLLEAVPEADLLARADPDDINHDGISGRPNRVPHHESSTTRLGRFGHKANEPDLRQQVAGAAFHDMGLTSPVFPHQDDPAHPDDQLEVTEDQLAGMTLLMRTTAVPARRDTDDPIVQLGERLFTQVGCADCHTPTLRTDPVTDLAALSEQTIHPYTDLLLHDLGPGLADGRPDHDATGSEWRTAPLWGLGLAATIHGRNARYLHDGRARTPEEATLWHAGEAQHATDNFKALPASDRRALLRFLDSL